MHRRETTLKGTDDRRTNIEPQERHIVCQQKRLDLGQCRVVILHMEEQVPATAEGEEVYA